MKYCYRLMTVLVVLNILIHLKGGLPEAAAQPVNFPDANLAAAVRGVLNLGATDPIMQTDLAGLNRLVAQEAGIRNLTGLDAAMGLQVLGLRDNQISDLRPLSGLTNLSWLDLGGNQISDLRPLAGLTNITTLGLAFNQISDIRPLSGLTNITTLGLAFNQISDIRPLSGLTNITWLGLGDNPITDLSPLSGLTNITTLGLEFNQISDLRPLGTLSNLEVLVVDRVLHENHPGVLVRIIPANTRIFFRIPNTLDIAEVTREELKRKRVFQHCGLGWAPQSPYGHRLEQPKVMMYALEFTFAQHGYTCSAIEIRTGDATLSHLGGWKLYLGTLYNPSYIPIEPTQANSQITNNILRLTPEMLGLDTFPCNTVGGLSHPLPGVQYVLKNDENVLVDTAFSCFIWGQNAYTTVNGVNVESQRRISSAALREMETPRIERYITNPTGVFITYMDIEAFTWDRVILSDWLLAVSESSAPGAPSAIQRKLVTTWGALKKQ